MQQDCNKDMLGKLVYLTGSVDVIEKMPETSAKEPFAEDVLNFLNDVARFLMKDARSRAYSDVVTFGFWIRKASTIKLKVQYGWNDAHMRLGRGTAFHIAPSNVPVNFAYSLASGLLMGNSNIVRVPSKEFVQVIIIADAINRALDDNKSLRQYIAMVRYGREKEVNDLLSGMADIRIIWGGDETIAEIRKSPLPPRSTEVTFADRYSIAVIDSSEYLNIEDKAAVAQDFYNDTYLSDQNACTSPRIVVWLGKKKEEAKRLFWEELHKVVEQKYEFQPIMGINKLTSSYLLAIGFHGTKIKKHEDNLVIRAEVKSISEHLMDLMDNCGFFLEYDCDDVMELKPLADHKRCQTIGMLGNADALMPLIKSGVKGIDRIVPLGHTMDFDLIWDGYDLASALTRIIKL